MDCVKVNKGFYKGCKGKVTKFYGVDTYEVAINNCKSESFYVNFEEDQLELAKGCEK
jgi:ribosomal protein L24